MTSDDNKCSSAIINPPTTASASDAGDCNIKVRQEQEPLTKCEVFNLIFSVLAWACTISTVTLSKYYNIVFLWAH